MSLSSLANEVIIECLQHLDFRSLLAFAQTCKGYNSLVRESTTLQCIVELSASGCLLAPGNRLSMDLLERVRRHTEAWRTLSFTSQKSVFTSWVYCHGSVCCQIRYNDEVLRSQTNMTFYQAPAVHRGVPEETWELSWTSPPDYSIIDIAFDPAQDLLVIVAINDDEIACATMLCLRSGLPHDDFGQGEAMTLGPLDRYIDIEVVDNVLTFTDDRSETTTFDIRTRKVTPLPTLLLSDPWPSSDPWASMSTILLSPRHFLGARKNGDGMFLSVSRSISDESSDYVGCSLALPNFFEPTGFHIAEITLLPSLSSVTLGTGAFVDDPAERIIHLRFYPVRGDRWEGEEPRCVDIYVLEKTLLLHLPVESPKERTLSWEEWRGEDNCMIVESPADFCEGGVCDNSVCGARAVRLSHNTPRRPRALEVLDFHPIRVACAGQDVEVVRETILPGRYLHNNQPLVTRLPYTVAKYVLPEDLQGNGRAVITENAVIFHPLQAVNVLDPSREIMMFCI